MTNIFTSYGSALLFGLILLFSAELSHGQNVADTLQLEEIEVVATRIQQPQKLQPVHIEIIDSTYLSFAKTEALGSLLAMQSGLFIKTNGPEGLANASQRGFSPEQIQILWEGIPINHAMLGQTDLSLLPVNFFSGVQVGSGIPSSAFGGGLSGGLYLNSDFNKTNTLSVSQSVGSFDEYHTGLQASISQKNLKLSLRSQYSNAENDYRYFNRAYQRVEERSHNRQEQKNVMASAEYEKQGNKINTVLWFSDSDKQIPGSILNTNSESKQEDQALRWLTSYDTRLGGINLQAKNYFDRIKLDYFDSEIGVESYSTTRRWLVSTELQYSMIAGIELKGELSGGITGVEANNYTDLKTRQQFSALANPEISLLNSSLRFYPALRFDSYSDFGNVLSPSLGLNYELIYDKLYLRGQASRDFNPPSFNALYWAQGGDPDLLPERSTNVEAGVEATFQFDLLYRAGITGFYSRVYDGIRWYPDQSGTYTPSNIEEFSSKGLELSTGSRFRPGNGFMIQLKQLGMLTRAEIEEPRFSGDAAVGNQMRYVPQWSYKSSLKISKNIFAGLIEYCWVGRRYITENEDINESLAPYHKVDVALKVQQNLLGLNFTGDLQLNNVLNADYEVVQWYAMPRSNVQFTLTATYNF